MNKNYLIMTIVVPFVISCNGNTWDSVGKIFGDATAPLYGAIVNPNYNKPNQVNTVIPDFWNNSTTSTTSIPTSLNPSTAADAAAKQGISNVTSGYWDNVGKAGQQVQNTIDAVAKDVWAHPEKYQDTPVQGSGSESGSTSGSVSSSRSTSGSSGHQCRLCKGTGRKIREMHPANVYQTKWCSECKKNVSTGHSHTTCDLCGGDGWID